MAAKGGVEPPTFRFSEVRITVRRITLTSVTCIGGIDPNTDECGRTQTDETKDETTMYRAR
jgi:hypothetical protein